MARLKIDYGIDLGTTNSAICRMEQGKPEIIKSDTLKDTVPSCVSVNKKGSIRVGDSAYNTMRSDKRRATKTWAAEDSNTYLEFKRTMGTDTKYHCSNVGKNFTSEELSAEVLKALKTFAINKTNEQFSSVVVTVPAKFTVNQKTATLEAAKLAGFSHCELLQEPIAAAMAYGLKVDNKQGIWMVFDFGGGTFDAALIKVEDGIIQVFDTEGDNYLGGKNLDYAIVDQWLIPYLQQNYAIDNILANDARKAVLRDAMKTYAEEVKNQLSFKDKEDIISNLGDLGEDDEGMEFELSLTLTQQQIFEAMRPYFQKAVDICKALLERNHLTGEQLDKLILVGGPTHNPQFRQMLRDQITPNVDTSIDPMTAVATGAALYASTLDAEIKPEDIAIDTLQLEVSFESTTVEPTSWVAVKLAQDSPLSSCQVELERADKAWASGRVTINRQGDAIEVRLNTSCPNSFAVKAYDEQGNPLKVFPDQITILQGTKVGAAPLPYNIGIAVYSDIKERGVFRMAKGMEKNRPLPAKGVLNDLRTEKPLRPGVDADKLIIPLYQVDDFSEADGKTASLYPCIGQVEITGADVANLIPANSLVDVTLKADSSEQMQVEVYFRESDETIEKQVNTSHKDSADEAEKAIQSGMKDAKSGLRRLKDVEDTTSLQEKVEAVKQEYANSSEKQSVLTHLREILREIEKKEDATEWERLEKALKKEFAKLEKAQAELGNAETSDMVADLRRQADNVMQNKNVEVGREVLDNIERLYFQLTMLYQCIGIIHHYHDTFSSQQWSNRARAQQLINNGLEAINAGNPTVETLLPIVQAILQLLPDDEQGNFNQGLLH